jgi:SAM-dependent methyltransferase
MHLICCRQEKGALVLSTSRMFKFFIRVKDSLRRRLAGKPPTALPVIPVAEITDAGIRKLESKNWRTHFAEKLNGRGLEIGPLHNPLAKHAGMNVEYVDRLTVAELRIQYPELNDLPLVEPDILDNAETLQHVKPGEYDFLISAHVLEHMRNPLGSLQNWCRVLKKGGLLYLIVPDKRNTFDSRRVRTTLEHMIQDFRTPSVERDFEHFLDWTVHVDGHAGNAALEQADKLVALDYSIHFHVFLPIDVARLIEWFSSNIRPIEIIEGPAMTSGSHEFHLLLRV